MGNPEVGSEFAGHRIDAVAGRGGMGVVYTATDLRLDRRVALKVISPELAEDPEFRKRFENEARLAASLDHPNVIPIHHAGVEDGVLYVTMRFVEGTDLRAMIAAGGAIEPRLVARITSQVGDALDAAHAAGLVHRDVKPANVLIAGTDEQAHAYLTDFGLTKVASSESGMTATGVLVGTIDYISPEQLHDGARVDARSDIYALGAMLYHALTGQVPYPRDSDAAKIFAHGTGPAPDPLDVRPGISAAFSEVVARGMAKEPEERYLSAGDLGRAALAAAEGESLSRAERSVARGDAAPLGARAVPARRATARGPRPQADTTVASERGPEDRRDRPAWALPVAGLAALAAVVAVLAVAGVFSGEDKASPGASPDAGEELTSDRLTVEPGGDEAMFRVVEEPGGEIVVIMSAADENGGFGEVARTTATGARARTADKDSGAIDLDVNQEGESYSRNGGEGLLSIGDHYAKYFGWNLQDERIEFY